MLRCFEIYKYLCAKYYMNILVVPRPSGYFLPLDAWQRCHSWGPSAILIFQKDADSGTWHSPAIVHLRDIVHWSRLFPQRWARVAHLQPKLKLLFCQMTMSQRWERVAHLQPKLCYSAKWQCLPSFGKQQQSDFCTDCKNLEHWIQAGNRVCVDWKKFISFFSICSSSVNVSVWKNQTLSKHQKLNKPDKENTGITV